MQTCCVSVLSGNRLNNCRGCWLHKFDWPKSRSPRNRAIKTQQREENHPPARPTCFSKMQNCSQLMKGSKKRRKRHNTTRILWWASTLFPHSFHTFGFSWILSPLWFVGGFSDLCIVTWPTLHCKKLWINTFFNPKTSYLGSGWVIVKVRYPLQVPVSWN